MTLISLNLQSEKLVVFVCARMLIIMFSISIGRSCQLEPKGKNKKEKGEKMNVHPEKLEC